MPAPDIRAYLQEQVGETVHTVARNKPNRIVAVPARRVTIETETGHRNTASIRELQGLADRVFDGEVVQVPLRRRSAFNLAVLATLPGVAYALNPRRAWREDVAAIESEFDDLEIEVDPAGAAEGKLRFRTHRLRERSAALVRAKKAEVYGRTGRLACEVCDFAERFGRSR